jgi:hypothetical protein
VERRHLAENQSTGSADRCRSRVQIPERAYIIKTRDGNCFGMNRFLEGVERWSDRLVGPALVVIVAVVVLELFFPDFAHHYHKYILVADYAAILVFVFDLSFKFRRATTWEGFLKDYWLEIIAIFPVFMVVRVFEFLAFLRTGELGQEVLHLFTRSERLVALSGGTELSRSARITSLTRGMARTPRLAKAAEFFKHPDEE